ncbi:DUF11 domain-containing protein [Paractinoplanes hotanensis]|uniref:DUF11 domain-containing protein n=1 Tax=Paractinoplanes hotanensis TaxID=2906497 RepID=A0ABT0XSI3_9ACTN|nr:DUF11 domain-containing protein [Actinoplanes hotanensis]MCM4076565.1 DUF11 domain-containing protein [Actinoplanes hotanensis]
MGVHRYLVVLALLVGGGAGLGAAAAPQDRTLHLSGPGSVAVGRTAVFTMQASDQEALGVEATLTLPTGVTYVSAEPGAVNTVEGGRNSGPCMAEGPGVRFCWRASPPYGSAAVARFVDTRWPGERLTRPAVASGERRT